jgi:hypothetical protein
MATGERVSTMNDQPKPYMPYVAQQMDKFKAKARQARSDAARLITQAEVWEDAASYIEIALDKERGEQGKSEL